MQCRCLACSAELTYDGEPPRFCSRCGTSLSTIISVELDATGAYTPTDKTYIPQLNGGHQQPMPDQIGGYRLLRKIGSGGMGSVYEAEDLGSGQHVALKLVKRGSDFSDSAAQRFRQEGRLASSISHPRCVFVIAADEDRGQPYIVMELMPGQTFIDLVRKEGPLHPSRAVSLIHDIIEGLQEAHSLGLVHRDVKPANCFIDDQGRAKIGDFGLAKVLDHSNGNDSPTAVELTGTGTFIGTPLYAAPEQIKGQSVDQQVDVYAVGATLYYLLTGKAPFEDQQSVTAVLARIVSEDPDPLSSFRQDLPFGLDAVVTKALERDRNRRYRDLESMRQALQAYLPGRTRIVRLGLRVAAYLVDFFTGAIVLGLLGLILGVIHGLVASQSTQQTLDNIFDENLLSAVIFAVLTQAIFFLLPETLWGTTLGKWCFRLRICDPAKGGKPSARKVLVRNCIFLLVTAMLHWTVLFFTDDHQKPPSHIEEATSQKTEEWRYDVRDTTLSTIVGMIILSLTMRRSNGYRGLHELYSGTSTIWLPPRPPRTQLDISRQVNAIPTRATLLAEPFTLGGFTVTHELWKGGSSAVYVGRDERLSRWVWVWLRPIDIDKIEPARRGVSRPARWRWVGGGIHDGRTWDAFLATPGLTLQSLIDQGHRFDWSAAYHLLAELTEEIQAAQVDQTIPGKLSASQLWIQKRGSVQCLDVPTSPTASSNSCPSEKELLSFLGQVGRMSLEGSMMLSGDQLRRAIPVAGHDLINKLLADPVQVASIQALQQDLNSLSERPFFITRWARFRSLLMQGIWLLIMLLVVMVLIGSTAFILQCFSGAWNDWQGIGSYMKMISPAAMPIYTFLLSIGWAAWWRGRWSFGLVGLAIRRYDGSNVERWRLAWRIVILAAPLLLLQFISSYTSLVSRWQGMIVHWEQLPVLLLVVVTLVWIFASPARAWHDRLAGTVIVPK